MKWKALDTKGGSFAFRLHVGRFVDGARHKGQPEAGISGHGITLPPRNTFARTVPPLSIFSLFIALSLSLFLYLSIYLDFFPLSTLLSFPACLEGEFREILNDTCIASPTPDWTNPIFPSFYKFPSRPTNFTDEFPCEAARRRVGKENKRRKKGALNGNLITSDELLMIDGTARK